jgi:hypothetical protein
MGRKHIRRNPVAEGGKPLSMLSIGEIHRCLFSKEDFFLHILRVFYYFVVWHS